MRRFFYRNFRVILGGGKKQFGIPVDPGNDDSCNRTDGRNLLDTWMSGKKGYLFVNNTEELMNADSSKVRNLRHFWTRGYKPEGTGGTLVTEQNRLMATIGR